MHLLHKFFINCSIANQISCLVHCLGNLSTTASFELSTVSRERNGFATIAVVEDIFITTHNRNGVLKLVEDCIPMLNCCFGSHGEIHYVVAGINVE